MNREHARRSLAAFEGLLTEQEAALDEDDALRLVEALREAPRGRGTPDPEPRNGSAVLREDVEALLHRSRAVEDRIRAWRADLLRELRSVNDRGVEAYARAPGTGDRPAPGADLDLRT